jgi:dTDP-4-dehydrorhamnose 3,5-epimerase
LGTRLDSVLFTPLNIVPVPAGDVMHAMRRSSPGFTDFGEAYFSCLQPGALKGWKRHRKMTLNLVVPVGLVSFAVIDMESGAGRRYELGPASYGRLTVPPGLWVAFRNMSAALSMILNLADLEHDLNEEDRADSHRFAFNWAAPLWPAGPDQRVAT